MRRAWPRKVSMESGGRQDINHTDVRGEEDEEIRSDAGV